MEASRYLLVCDKRWFGNADDCFFVTLVTYFMAGALRTKTPTSIFRAFSRNVTICSRPQEYSISNSHLSNLLYFRIYKFPFCLPLWNVVFRNSSRRFYMFYSNCPIKYVVPGAFQNLTLTQGFSPEHGLKTPRALKSHTYNSCFPHHVLLTKIKTIKSGHSLSRHHAFDK